ncbi:hypothetical protein [Enterovibrio baiacu]|uniref:hypothetical protein n=1 Tax=Enterovibrio baiacu TaxID=2491023 RepID=UPI003D10B6C0
MNISGIMISFNPNTEELKKVLLAAIKVYDNIYIYDNFSDNQDEVVDCVMGFEHVHMYPSAKNIGISGLNTLAERAFSEGADAVSIIDQDSFIPANFRQSVEKFFSIHPNAVCAPLHIDINQKSSSSHSFAITKCWMTKKKIRLSETCKSYIRTDFAIGSGMTFNMFTWKNIGGFDTQYFIDCADLDMCLRLRAINIDIFLLSDCIMSHEIGLPRERILFFHVSMHKPIRHYYYFLGILSLISKGYVPLGFKIHYGFKLFVQYVMYCFIVKEAKSHRKEINRAFRDYFGR